MKLLDGLFSMEMTRQLRMPFTLTPPAERGARVYQALCASIVGPHVVDDDWEELPGLLSRHRRGHPLFRHSGEPSRVHLCRTRGTYPAAAPGATLGRFVRPLLASTGYEISRSGRRFISTSPVGYRLMGTPARFPQSSLGARRTDWANSCVYSSTCMPARYTAELYFVCWNAVRLFFFLGL